MDHTPLLRVNHLIAARQNRQTILRLIQQDGPCSQRQLAQQTRLRASTMSYIIRDLTRWGFIEASGVIPTKRTGRKEVLLKLDGSRGWAAGIDLDQDATEFMLVDASHEVLFRKKLDLQYDGSAGFFKAFCREFEEARKTHGLAEKRSLGAGISVAGVVDSARGTLLKSVPLKLENHPLGDKFADKIKLSTLVEHNALCGGFAEKLLGAAKPYEHFLTFLIRSGGEADNFYGMAFFLNGDFYRGAHSSAGELDRLLAPSAGAASRRLVESPEFLKQFAGVVASLSNLFDPQAVILVADDDFKQKVPFSKLEPAVRQMLIEVPNRKISLHWNQLPNGAAVYGAALMQLHSGMNKLLSTLVR